MMQRVLKRLTSIPTPVIFAFSLTMALLLLWQQDAISKIRPAIANADPWIVAAGLLLYLAGLALLCRALESAGHDGQRRNQSPAGVGSLHHLGGGELRRAPESRASESCVSDQARAWARHRRNCLDHLLGSRVRSCGARDRHAALDPHWRLARPGSRGRRPNRWTRVRCWCWSDCSPSSSRFNRAARLRSIVFKMRNHFTEALKHPGRRPRQTIMALIGHDHLLGRPGRSASTCS